MKFCQDYPCADCKDVVPIGDREGLCDYCDQVFRKFVVDLFAVYPQCPKKKDEGFITKKEKKKND